jgi:hypothetical protein
MYWAPVLIVSTSVRYFESLAHGVPGSNHQQSGSCTFLTHVMMPEGEGANDLNHLKMTECEGVVGKHGDSSVTAVLRRTLQGGLRARSWNVVLTQSLI